VDSRLMQARIQGAEAVDFDSEDPVKVLRDLTDGTGVDRVIDAVGIDAVRAHHGPAAEKSQEHKKEFDRELREIIPAAKKAKSGNGRWKPGDGPSQVLRWAVEAIAKAGTLSIVGVYPAEERTFPLGEAMGKNLTINMGNCNHRRYIPMLLRLVRSGQVDPTQVLTQQADLSSALDAYAAFDKRRSGWMKVQLTSA